MSPFAPGLRIHDRFTVERRIGVGGMSEVWRAYDTVLGRPVAVKVLSSAYAGSPEATLHEARSAARIADPNIAAVHDYGELPVDGGSVPYLVMELVEGEDLATRLQSGPLPWPRAAAITAQIASGLAAAHRLGVVHRDVKPGNVMLTPTGVKLLDFGIAAAAYGPDRGLLIGTPSYAAPERLRPGAPTPSSDVYAVGVLLFEMLTGAPPRRYADWAQAQAGWRNPPVIPPIPGVPPRLADLMTACLAPDPAARPAAAEVARVAGAVAAQPAAAAPAAFAAGSARPPTVAPPTMVEAYAEPRPPRSIWPVAWISVAIILAIGIALVFVALRNSDGTTGSPTGNGSTAAVSSPSPEPSTPPVLGPQELVAQFDQIVADARSSGRISEDTAQEIDDRMDNVREHLDESGPRLAKRVREVTRKLDDLVKDGDLDPETATQLEQILDQLAD